jgi:hypothetical protein
MVVVPVVPSVASADVADAKRGIPTALENA